ncbi:Photosynthetic NDH subunit of subcomplex B 3, chloroplastic, variant 2 [Ancistrocladus abbreviatus]
MGTLQLKLNPCALSSSSSSASHIFKYNTKFIYNDNNVRIFSSKRGRVRAIGIVPETDSQATSEPEEPPSVDLAFVHPVLLPDGTPDVHLRTAKGGQKLRDIMLDSDMELYGPYARPLLNCGGGGTCGTCIVEVIEGKELLSPRTDKEKEKLKKKPKNWRLACQTTVGTADSRGMVCENVAFNRALIVLYFTIEMNKSNLLNIMENYICIS